MHTVSEILKEIVELSHIKSAYNHFLASHAAQIEVENATYINNNKRVLTIALAALQAELREANTQQKKAKQFNAAVVKQPLKAHSEQDYNAILHFNRDRRFKITE